MSMMTMMAMGWRWRWLSNEIEIHQTIRVTLVCCVCRFDSIIPFALYMLRRSVDEHKTVLINWFLNNQITFQYEFHWNLKIFVDAFAFAFALILISIVARRMKTWIKNVQIFRRRHVEYQSHFVCVFISYFQGSFVCLFVCSVTLRLVFFSFSYISITIIIIFNGFFRASAKTTANHR